MPCCSTSTQWKGILFHSECYEPPGQKPCLCTATWPWGLKIKDEQPKSEASRHSCQAGISRPEDCSITNAPAHVGWQFCTISYSFPQLFPSSLCLPTITPTCALLLSPTSSLFCLFAIQGLSVSFFLFIQYGSAEKSKFTIFSMFSFLSQDFIKIKFLERRLTDSVNTALSHNIPVSIKAKSSQIMQCADLASTNGEFGHCRDVWSTALSHINSPQPQK